jgi:hypothetical protein
MGRAESPTEVTGRADPLPTMMDEGSIMVGGRTDVKLTASVVVWLEAPEFVTQSVTTRGVKGLVLKELANDSYSHAPLQGDQIGVVACCWCRGGTGRGAKEGPPGAP